MTAETIEQKLIEAETRIAKLETAAVKAAFLLAQAAKEQKSVDTHTVKLVSCVELLFDELAVEGLKHCEYVENSLRKVATAVTELKKTTTQRDNANKSAI